MIPGRSGPAALLMLVAVAGCSPLQTSEPAPTRYHLEPPATPIAPASLAQLPQPLAVARPAVAPWLDNDRIALLVGEHRLEHAADARWSAPLPALLRSLARATLSRGGGPLSVQPSQAPGARHILLLEVEAFHAAYRAGESQPPVVRVELVVSLRDTHRGETLAAVRVSREERVEENRLARIVSGLERLFVDALVEATASIADGYEAGQG